MAKTGESESQTDAEGAGGSTRGSEAKAEEVRAQVLELRRERAKLIDKVDELEEQEEAELDKLQDLLDERAGVRSYSESPRRPRRRSRARRGPREYYDEPVDRARDDESSLWRALVDSYLAGVRTWGQVIADFADAVAERRDERERYRVEEEWDDMGGRLRGPRRTSRRGQRRRGARSDIGGFSGDLYEGWLDTADEASDVPRRVIDDFYDNYTRYRR